MSKCAYCNKEFVKPHFNSKYCSDDCRSNAKREQDRKAWFRWFYKNKKRIYDTMLGTGSLSEHCQSDFEVEAVLVKNELRRLGLC